MSLYPEYRHANSFDSDRTASDATLGDEQPSMFKYTDDHDIRQLGNGPFKSVDAQNDDGDDVDEDDGNLGFDQDQEVGLMQMHRAKHSSFRKSKFRFFAAGYWTFFGVILGFILAIPLLQWLSSSSPVSSLALSPHPSSNSSHPTPSSLVGVEKYLPSTNYAAGKWGLANAKTFHLDFNIPGWDTIAKSAAANGLNDQAVASFIALHGHKLLPIEIDTVLGGSFRPLTDEFTWSAEDPDEGVFVRVDWTKKDIYVQDVTHLRKEKTGHGQVAPSGGKVLFVKGQDVLDDRGNHLNWSMFKISPDMRWVMFFTDALPQWRHSKHFNVWLFDVVNKKTVAIAGGPSQPPSITYAAWQPKSSGSSSSSSQSPGLAYVQENDLYFMPHPQHLPIRLTNDGSTTVFNAVPDWVYEEEIFSGDSSMWLSPQGSKLVYLRLDETQVPIYEFPVYNPDKYVAGKTTPYLESVKMKYPKPGYPNPTVSVHMVDLDEIQTSANQGNAAIRSTRYLLKSPEPTPSLDGLADEVNQLFADKEGAQHRLVTEVKWVNDDQILIRETDRNSDVMRLVLYDLAHAKQTAKSASVTSDMIGASSSDLIVEGTVVRFRDTRKEGTGWIRCAQTIEPLSRNNQTLTTTAYIDILVSPQGYRHIAFFDTAASDKPLFLTEGQWEVDEIEHVDPNRRRVYFTAGKPNPANRHLFYVTIPDSTLSDKVAKYGAQEPIALTNDGEAGFFKANFDPKGAYYELRYDGPDVPFQKVVGVDQTDFEVVLQDNAQLRNISCHYVKPQTVFYTINLTSSDDGSDVPVSVFEVRPHDFDASGNTRYPVLIEVYGGPDSQTVKATWNRAQWHQYLASNLGYIVCVIDGRGTGFRGQSYRSSVARNLGILESQDINSAAKQISSLPYVDDSRIGIWGWSYGGYLTSKIVETDQHIFNLAISVAPVTNWQFYDSVYTERYMKSPTLNSQGYFNSSIHVTPGFSNTNYFLFHGSADDNVHLSNSAHLLDMLTQAKSRGFRFRMFTDSAHSMSIRGAYIELYENMSSFLKELWGVGGGR